MRRTSTVRSLSRPESSSCKNEERNGSKGSSRKICMWRHIDFAMLQQSTKINLANRNIEVLDNMASKLSRSGSMVCSQIKTLYLSNNLIASIEHIGQFPCLQILSLSNNLIAQLTALYPLSSLGMLSHVSVQDNPVCASPFYLPCLLATTASAQVRVVDGIAVTSTLISQAISNWQIYKEGMSQLTNNYIKLMYLAQHWKKQSLHSTIKLAASCFHGPGSSLQFNADGTSIQAEQQSNLNFELSMIMKQAEHDISQLPSYFMRAIERALYQDVCRIANMGRTTKHKLSPNMRDCPNEYIFIMHEQDDQEYSTKAVAARQKQQGNLQQIKMNGRGQVQMAAMRELMQKQREKIVEIKHKFITWNLTKHHIDDMHHKDIKVVQGLLQSVLAPHRQSHAREYYSWKLLARIIAAFKMHSALNNKMKYASATIARVINTQAIQCKMDGMQRVKKWARIYPMIKVVGKFSFKMREQHRWAFQMVRDQGLQLQRKQITLKQQQQQQWHMKMMDIEAHDASQKILYQYLNKLHEKKWLRVWFQGWKNLSTHERLIKTNTFLIEKIHEHKIRESKLINKVCLLEKLLADTEDKLKEKDQQTDPKQLLTLISQQCDNLGYYAHPTILTRSPSLSSQYQSPRIRKNISKQGKQNIDNNQQNETKVLKKTQRVFNSTKKLLKI